MVVDVIAVSPSGDLVFRHRLTTSCCAEGSRRALITDELSTHSIFVTDFFFAFAYIFCMFVCNLYSFLYCFSYIFLFISIPTLVRT